MKRMIYKTYLTDLVECDFKISGKIFKTHTKASKTWSFFTFKTSFVISITFIITIINTSIFLVFIYLTGGPPVEGNAWQAVGVAVVLDRGCGVQR